ncbi:hypothetical protein ESB00_08180 [Oleiharenicola lentus]|uniref:Uncharacterized protein n=1 Tax=Oleiharenicola lentus TaxID=2508720 RepID=A0A4Q1CA31_9BACT|nr:hypothetical protein [Oleiharenicola lentus]RXK55848.1 hypothetical protein ESB00_08180 [Oleiharenicola lentus]
MADYHCWPLWHHGSSKVGNIDPRSLGLSTALQTRLKHWAEEYDSHLDLSDPAAVSWTPEEETAFDREGRRLCTALANEVGSGFDVCFFDQKTARCIPVLELYTGSQEPNQVAQTTPGLRPSVSDL